MTLWPRSLLWRTFLLLALLALATTTGWFLIFRTYEQQPRARQIAQNIVSVVNLTRAALVTAQADRRRELLVDLADSENIQVYPSEPGEQIVPLPNTPLVNLINEQVHQQLGGNTRLAFQRDGLPGLWVTFDIEGDQYWVRVPRERLERRVALQWIGWGALALALTLLAAYLIVSHISRPLKTLARAATEIGHGRLPARVPESGAAEVRTLSHAFNEMARDLARLDEDRALILAGVSHDLRTPLARLRLGVEMSAADESIREGMNADIEEMDRIIGQFLDFARAGEAGERAEVTAIDDIVQEAIEHYGKLGHDLEADLASRVSIPARPKALRRAVANLVDNALRYGREPVSIRTRSRAAQALIEVMDRGRGIPPGDMERMKLPFTRLEPARVGGSGGSGLGLAIVERVAQSHGGRLELEPREGGGLVARLVLSIRGCDISGKNGSNA